MPDHDKMNAANYALFDYMRTDELKEILKKNSEQPDDATDVEKIFYILEVLEKREAKKGLQRTDVDDAWEVFKREYLPLAEKGIALYDDEPDEVELDKATTVPFPQKKRRKVLRRGSHIAAAVIAIVLLGSLTAHAMGFPIWDSFMAWTAETFGFRAPGQQEEILKEIPDQYQELNEKLMQYGAGGIGIIPTYIPEGYQVVRLDSAETTDDAMYVLLLSDGENNIVLHYRLYLGDDAYPEYQKNDGDPEIYEVGGIKHYIAQNVDTFICMWRNGNLECSISGVNSREELIKIINSIYEV